MFPASAAPDTVSPPLEGTMRRWTDPSKNKPIPLADNMRLLRDVRAKGGATAHDQLRRWTMSTVSVAKHVATDPSTHELSIPLFWVRLYGLLHEVRETLVFQGQAPYGLEGTRLGQLAKADREHALGLIDQAWEALTDDERLFVEAARHLHSHPQQWGRRLERKKNSLKDTVPVVLLDRTDKKSIQIEALDAALARAVAGYEDEQALARDLADRLFESLAGLLVWARGEPGVAQPEVAAVQSGEAAERIDAPGPSVAVER